tara:strand:- start:61 stop:534 length:474 start_codon:yes stop_codon:yes gene_type:complete
MYENQLLNAFLGHKDNVDKIVLLYRWSSDPLFSKFEQALKKFEAFDSSFDPDPHHVVFIFKIPDKHKQNYEQLKMSKYSRMDDLYKLKILDFHDMEIDQTLGQILFRASERRLDLENKLDAKIDKQSELLSVLNMDKETLNLNDYISEKIDIRGFEE